MSSVRRIVATYIRAPQSEIDRARRDPSLTRKLDPRVALRDGRAIDIGRRWEELGCLLDGGITRPTSGPVVGDVPLPSVDEHEAWSYLEPARVAAIAKELAALTRGAFMKLYRVDEDNTADALPEDRTGMWGDAAANLFERFDQLRAHYWAAAERGEGMLVRIGERLDPERTSWT